MTQFIRLGEFLVGMQGARQQPAILGCLVFGLHDATLGAQANISRLGKQQTLCVCKGGVEPGCHHRAAFWMSAADLRREVTFPAGQVLPLNLGAWAQG